MHPSALRNGGEGAGDLSFVNETHCGAAHDPSPQILGTRGGGRAPLLR